MNFTAKDVSDLRAQTGIGMMECKKALTEANGDKEEAIKILREKGLAVAEKKASRIAAEGVVDILAQGDSVAMVEVNSETDFVAKNDSFKSFVKGVLETILSEKPADVDALLACKFSGTDDTVDAVLKDKTFQIGEKLSIRRFAVVDGLTSTYVHGGGTIGVIVKAESECADKDAVKAVLKNVALQIAAMNPKYLDKDSVPAADLEAEKEILMAQINNDEKNASKPEAVKEKMILGKIGKFYDTNCLLEQEYVKEDKVKVSAYVASEAKNLGADIKITSFLRYEKGEGIEKREDNFAEEIAKLTQK
ncbi:MAG: elongation factor Ts [Clostridiales bacterium]|nr:MAG: elongation factor Ts [Clostridiales bacterium]